MNLVFYITASWYAQLFYIAYYLRVTRHMYIKITNVY